MLGNIRSYVIEILYLLPAIVPALCVHEYFHAQVSTWLGDPLPRSTGRLTLDPRKHIDIMGFLMLLIVRFGWAKPVYVDPRYYKHKKLGMSLVAIAGPIANLLLGFICTALYILCFRLGSSTVEIVIRQILAYCIIINVGLAVFNLIPISPLDGSKLLAAFLPLKAYEKVLKFERYGFIVLIVLLFDIPLRLLTILGVPYSLAQWFSLTTYLGIARGYIMDAYFWLLDPLARLVLG